MSDLSHMFFECVARDRLARLEAEAERAALLRSLRPARRPVRVVLGQGLVTTGRWLLGPAAEPGDESRRAPAASLPARVR